MDRSNRLLLGCAILLVIVSVCGWSEGGKEVEDSRDLPVRQHVSISTGSSKVNVETVEGGKISVKVVYTYSPDAFTPVYLVEDNEIILKEEYQRRSGAGKATWYVAVPANTKITCSTGSGDIVVNGVQRAVSVNSGSGSVNVENSGGGVDANTGSGQVRFENIRGGASADTGSGKIVMKGVRGDVRTNSGSARVEVADVSGSLSISSGSGDVFVTGASIEGESTITAGSGDITVTLASTLSSDVSLSNGSGKSTLNYGGHSIEGYFEFVAEERRGKIVSPFAFDDETTFTQNTRTYMRKSFTRQSGSPKVTISTGTGTAELKSR
jgi:DUF4097 and DUF4098 domain-containing protein YvlB